jgi:hypothetical protein
MSSPIPDEHLDQARENRAHAEWLISTNPTDQAALRWAVTAAIYSALHGLTAHLLTQGIRIRNHSARASALRDPNSGVPPSVIYAYRILNDLSVGSRYELWSFTLRDVRDLLDQESATVAAFAGM